MAEKLKILHIEDLPEDVELVARALNKLSSDYERKVVSSRGDYVLALERFVPDIILSDHSLPSFNSIEALQIARQLGCRIPFILVTATVSDEFAVSIIKQGANDYILKERLERLPSAIEVAVETHKLEREKEAGEQRFRALIEYSEDMLTLISADKSISYISPAVERLLGYSNNDALCYMDLIHASDRDAMTRRLQEVFDNPGKPVQTSTRYLKKDGSYLWVEGTLTNMLAVYSVSAIVANFRDVTSGKETEERFRRIVETAQEGVWITDENRKTIFVNDKLCEILEYSPAEMMGKTGPDFMDEADRPAGLEAIKRREQGIKETLEVRFLTKTRRYMWANVSASPIIDEQGNYRGALAMVTDITLRKIAEEALVRSEELMRTILENSIDAITLYDTSGKVLYESPAVARMLGYKPAEIMGRNRTNLFHPDELEAADTFLKLVLSAPGKAISTHRRMRHKNGHYIWTEGTATNLLGDNKVNGIITNFRDVSDRVMAEKALRESEYKFRSLIQHSSDAVTVINEKEEIIFASDSLYKITGFTVEELMSAHSRQYVHPDDIPYIRQTFQDLLENPGTPKDVSYRRLKKDGSYFWCEGTATNLINEPAVGGIVINFRDITERKEAEKQQQANLAQIKAAAEMQSAIINSLDANIALLDNKGIIVNVNDSWKKFAETNFLIGNTQAIGDDYVAILENATEGDDVSAKAMVKGIRDVLSGKMPEYSMEYLCICPSGELWFRATVTQLSRNPEKGVVISYTNITETKLSQLALQRSEANLTAIIENADANIYSIDKERRYVLFNSQLRKAVIDAFGIEIAPGDNAFEFLAPFAPQEVEFWKETYDTAFTGRKMQFTRDYSTGTQPAFVSFSIYPIWDQGEVIGLSCFSRDVTEQKMSEEKIIYTEHLLSEAQQVAQMGNWNFDVVKNETYWSPGERELYGVDETFVPSFTSFETMIYPDDRERVMGEIAETRKKGTILEHQFRIIRADGQVRVLNTKTRSILDQNGNTVRMYGIQQDVTDMEKAMETLSRSEANLNTIFNHGDTIYILIDTEFKIVSFNQLARHYAEDELQAPLAEGAYLMDCIAADRRAVILNTLNNLLKKGEENVETGYSLSDKSDKSYYVRYFPVSNEQKEIFGIIIAINDITERKLEELKTLKLLELLQKKNKDLGQFAYIVSHNLRAPIAKILGLVSLFESNKPGEMPDPTLIDLISGEATNLDTVVKDLNTIITARDHDTEPREYVSFEEQLKLILQVLDGDLQACGGEVTYYFPEPGIFTIKSYLYSIMYNLVSNAIKYRSPKQQLSIYIQTKRENEFICLSVADNGMGMDMNKYQRKIFGLYKRFHGDSIPGKGLGLYLVKTQAETLGGMVDVRSAVNEGTTFKISIPI